MKDEGLWYLIGRFLGDGWTRTRKDRNNNVSSMIICTSKINGEDKLFEEKYQNGHITQKSKTIRHININLQIKNWLLLQSIWKRC